MQPVHKVERLIRIIHRHLLSVQKVALVLLVRKLYFEHRFRRIRHLSFALNFRLGLVEIFVAERYSREENMEVLDLSALVHKAHLILPLQAEEHLFGEPPWQVNIVERLV